MHQPQKAINLELHLSKFSQFQAKQAELNASEEKK
jgi:hypothetical protein